MKIKLHQSKEGKTEVKNSQFSSLNCSMIKIRKEEIKQTKPSIHINSHSIHLNGSSKKPIKQKKSSLEIPQKKQKTIRSPEPTTSGRGKTIKTKVKKQKSCDFQTLSKYKLDTIQESGSISYREYCLIENSFVPIVSKTQQQKLEEIMQSTADTSHMFEDFNKNTFRNVFPFKMRDMNHNFYQSVQISRIRETEEIILPKKEKKISKKEVEIQASPFYEEVGIQYSERPHLTNLVEKIKQKNAVAIKAVEIDIQTDFKEEQKSPVKNLNTLVEEPEEQKDESLSDLLIKLEFKHLPNEKAFLKMSKQEKQHYSQLLNSLISKLNYSPREKQKEIVPIKTKQMIQIEQVHLIPLEEIKLKYEKLEMEIIRRESYQMSWVQRRFEPAFPEIAFDTSMLAVSSFLLNFFCYIELNYMEEFLENIQKQYGPSYFSEYLRITRGLNTQIYYGTVLDKQLFEQFCQQLKQISPLQKAHLRSIFDFINDLLDAYRPSYYHKGEPFPWSLKMYKSICQYVIDESSMEVIFIETKENIQQAVSMLCGLIVDENLYRDISEINPLALKRNHKENILIDMWLKDNGEDTHFIECQVTKVFAEISNQIYDMLLLELLNEIPLYKNS